MLSMIAQASPVIVQQQLHPDFTGTWAMIPERGAQTPSPFGRLFRLSQDHDGCLVTYEGRTVQGRVGGSLRTLHLGRGRIYYRFDGAPTNLRIMQSGGRTLRSANRAFWSGDRLIIEQVSLSAGRVTSSRPIVILYRESSEVLVLETVLVPGLSDSVARQFYRKQ
jgi:hypothetical protein